MDTKIVSSVAILVFITSLMASPRSSQSASPSSAFSFADNFDIMWSEEHFKTSPDGQIWYLPSTKKQMCSDTGAGPERDELDFEFLGNRTGEPYLIQTNVYRSGVGNREMRHMLWFDPTEEFHTYSILWNSHQIIFFIDQVPIRVYKNSDKPNNFFPNEKPMYLFSSIWNADDWATRGGLEKTNWKKAPFMSSYKDFNADGCQWEDPYPACVSTTTEHWWDQYEAWHLTDSQKKDFAWVQRNLVIYDYCKDTKRFEKLPEECGLSPWD
ncbi:hypothetical protein Sjap_025293 [Stephania japonica]|uniref:Xyloglucan endotransglucosylase/hydrolase n=1 Tax=Stephania japonica TaxID=461633 RepID=A0AAP0HHE7_9MAGN